MGTETQQQERRGNTISSLNAAIEVLNLAGGISDIIPAKAVFGTVSVLLVAIRDSMINQVDSVELGLDCANVCIALYEVLKGKTLSDLNDSVWEAIGQLTTLVTGIQQKVTKQGKRNAASRLFHAKNDKEKIATWRADLTRILLVFNAELAIGTHVTVVNTHALVSGVHHGVENINSTVSDVHHGVSNIHVIVANIHSVISDMRREMQKREEGTDERNRMTQNSISGELPPPPPRDFFGRDELIEKIVDLANDNRIKQRFGDYRRFIRCDKFPPLAAHFLRRLSEVIGAGIENPEDLTPLRPFLSSKEMIVILDNAESILDPQGAGSQEIYSMVEELSQSRNICLCITSRISIIPPNCEIFNVRTLSVEAGRDAFYQIYKIGERSDLIDKILEQLDFHPLSITLLATVAQRNTWNTKRLTEEWKRQRTGMLHTHHNKSLAATIKLSLASPTFQELGPDARGLLEVIAFFPQGINEDNFEWLFPTISDGINILDTFCTLSLTYRSDGYVTMLAPLRDHIRPKDPISSPLLCMAKESYFTRLSVDLHPQKPGFVEARWITSEDGNVEHLLDVFTTIDANSDDVWDACVSFMGHLRWYKGRLIALRPSIEGLPDNHRSKPQCLFALSWLFMSAGNHTESKQLFAHAMDLWRERGDDHQVAQTLLHLSYMNTKAGFYEEAMRQAEEAFQINKQLGSAVGQAGSLGTLAWALHQDKQLDAAEEAASRAIDLLPEEGEELLTSQCHRVLSEIHHSKGNTAKAVSHLEVALGIVSPLHWNDELFWIHSFLARLYLAQGRVDDAHTHIEHFKSYPVVNVYHLGFTAFLQAHRLYLQRRLEEAKLEALRAVDMFEKFELPVSLGDCRGLLRDIEEAIDSAVTPGSDDNDRVTESE